jgi:hypothetical protein
MVGPNASLQPSASARGEALEANKRNAIPLTANIPLLHPYFGHTKEIR